MQIFCRFMSKYLHISNYYCTFALAKVKQQNFETMFGVKSSNQPITGKFAEEFVRHLLETQKQQKEEEMDEPFEIVCE